MKINILLFFVLIAFTSCFKDVPTTEFSKVGGAWKIEEVTIEYFDSLGTATTQKTFSERGYIMLTYNEGTLAGNAMSYSFKAENEDFNISSTIAYAIGQCNRWDVAVTANQINFGVLDPNTNYTTQIIALTVDKLRSNSMEWFTVDRNTNGSLSRKETYKLKRP